MAISATSIGLAGAAANAVARPLVLIDGYAIDVTLSEDHSFEAEATQYPVESGADVTDNVRVKPIVVTLEGVVSDSPFGEVRDIRESDGNFVPEGEGGDGTKPSEDALERLIQIRDNREPVTIETSLKTFESMVMTSLSVPRESGEPEQLRFTATFQQVLIITNNRTLVRVAVPIAAKKVDKGPKVKVPWPKFVPPGFVDRRADPASSTWFDPDINRWREGYQFEPSTGKHTFFKGKPVTDAGSDAPATARLSDAEINAQNSVLTDPKNIITLPSGQPGPAQQNIGQGVLIVPPDLSDRLIQ